VSRPHLDKARDEPLLELTDISKTYPGARALRGVRFDLRAGEIHAILGENGAGKSTLIKVIAGVEAADPGGEIRIDGVRVRDPSPRSMQARGIAAVYQSPSLFGELSVAENLCLGEEGRIVSWRRRRERAAAMLRRVGVALDPDARAGGLRMAEKQALEIARALDRRARVLILDEPTAPLAQHEADRLLALVGSLRASGTAIVYISHRLEEVLRIADRYTILRDGQLVATLPRDGAGRTDLLRLMAGREPAELFPKEAVEPGAPALEVEGLGCARSGVHGVGFALRRGEILGLGGLVGSGRTELARILFGLTPADEGMIRVDGRSVAIRSVPDAVSHGIAYLPEDRSAHGIIGALPVRDNISLASLRRLFGSWPDARREEALASGLSTRLGVRAASQGTPARSLSGGNQQKVALARWLATAPRVLILDEPTQGVDVGAKAEIHALMGRLAAEGTAILLISSELTELLALSDRVGVMRGGRLAAVLPAAEATRERVLHLALEGAGP
jgi:rhamnose transport system ATP-binding protein